MPAVLDPQIRPAARSASRRLRYHRATPRRQEFEPPAQHGTTSTRARTLAPPPLPPSVIPPGQSLHQICRTSIARPPDWRYRTALHFLDRGIQPREPFTDSLIERLYQLLGALRTDTPLEQLDMGLRTLHDAHVIYTEAVVGMRSVLEARLLTRLSYRQIAAQMDLPLRTVTTYAEAFFHVRDRRQTPDYIASRVVRRHPVMAPTVDNVLKLAAYAGGPRILDDFISTLVAGKITDLKMDLDPIPGDWWVRALAATWLTPINERTALAWFKLRDRQQKTRWIFHEDKGEEADNVQKPVKRNKHAVRSMRVLLREEVRLLHKAFSRTTINANPLLRLLLGKV